MPCCRPVFSEEIKEIKIMVTVVHKTAVDLETLQGVQLVHAQGCRCSNDLVSPGVFSGKKNGGDKVRRTKNISVIEISRTRGYVECVPSVSHSRLGEQRQAYQNRDSKPTATKIEAVQQQCYFHYVFSVPRAPVSQRYHLITFLNNSS